MTLATSFRTAPPVSWSDWLERLTPSDVLHPPVVVPREPLKPHATLPVVVDGDLIMPELIEVEEKEEEPEEEEIPLVGRGILPTPEPVFQKQPLSPVTITKVGPSRPVKKTTPAAKPKPVPSQRGKRKPKATFHKTRRTLPKAAGVGPQARAKW